MKVAILLLALPVVIAKKEEERVKVNLKGNGSELSLSTHIGDENLVDLKPYLPNAAENAQAIKEKFSQAPSVTKVTLSDTLDALIVHFDANVLGEGKCDALFDEITLRKLGEKPQCTFRYDYAGC